MTTQLEKRKYQRLLISSLEEICATIMVDDLKLSRPVRNISYRGMGLSLEPVDEELLKECGEIDIVLEFQQQRAATKGRIVSSSKNHLGVSFTALDDKSRGIISSFIDPRICGATLKRVEVADPNNRLWIGANNTRVQRFDSENFEIVFASMFVQFIDGMLHTGQVRGYLEHSTIAQRSYTGDDIELIYDGDISYETMRQSYHLLQYADIGTDQEELLNFIATVIPVEDNFENQTDH